MKTGIYNSLDDEYLVIDYGLQKTQVPLGKITAILPDGFTKFKMNCLHAFTVELVHNKRVNFVITKKDSAPVLKDIYDKLKLNQKVASIKIAEFSHPERWILLRHRYMFRFHLFVGVLLFLITVASLGTLPRFVALMPLVPLYLIALIVIIKEKRYFKTHPAITFLMIEETSIRWKIGDESFLKQIRDIETFNYSESYGRIRFNDGTEINDLEKLGYWPQFCEALNQKLTNITDMK